jgi:riboflavin synthase
MFSGIIKSLGEVKEISQNGTNYTFTIASDLSKELSVDQSVAHNGVCLTVESCNQNEHTVTAVNETILKSNLGNWKIGDKVNLEKCITLSSLLDGHMVQGHVDDIGELVKVEDQDGSWNLTVRFNPKHANLLIEKGSVSLNGISLTVFNVTESEFTVTIIPYTWEHTMLHQVKEGDKMNLEFDVVGKYIARNLKFKAQ